MLSIKSVAGSTPLSAAAKASIIHTIADSALASFVVIQVGRRQVLADGTSLFFAVWRPD
jgi:hypothetical protein